MFLRLVAGSSITLDGQTYRPARMRGWYHALFVGTADGEERELSIDDLLAPGVQWVENRATSAGG